MSVDSEVIDIRAPKITKKEIRVFDAAMIVNTSEYPKLNKRPVFFYCTIVCSTDTDKNAPGIPGAFL